MRVEPAKMVKACEPHVLPGYVIGVGHRLIDRSVCPPLLTLPKGME